MSSLREGLELFNGGVVCLVGAGGKTSLMFRLARELSLGGDAVLTTTTTKIRMPTRAQAEAVVISPLADTVVKCASRFHEKKIHLAAAAAKTGVQGKLQGYSPEVIEELWGRGRFRWILVEADGAAGRALKAPSEHEPVVPPCTHKVIGIVGLDAAGRPLDDRSVFRPEIFAEHSGLELGRAVTAAAIAASLTHVDSIFKRSPDAAGNYLFLNKAESSREIKAGREIVRIIKATAGTRIKRILIGSILKNPPVMEHYDLF